MFEGETTVVRAGVDGAARRDLPAHLPQRRSSSRRKVRHASTCCAAPVAAIVTRRHQGAARPPNFAGGSTVWDALAQCESGGNWADQHRQRLLRRPAVQPRHLAARYGGSGYPHQHSRETQIAIADEGPRRHRRLRRLARLCRRARPPPLTRRIAADPSRSTAGLGQRSLGCSLPTPGPGPRHRRIPPPVRGSSARRRCVRSRPRSTCAPPSSAARTSSSTPTPCAASCASPGSAADDVVARGRPRARLADPGAARGRRPGSSRSRSTRCSPRALPAHRSRRTPPTSADRLRGGARPTRCGSPTSPARRRPRWSPTCPTTSRCRCCCTCWRCCRRCERGLVMVQAEVADRLAAPPGSKVYGVPSVKAAWFADVRRAGAVGRNVFWPAPNVDSGLVAWTRREPPATHRDPRSRCSRSSTRRSPSAARRCARRCARSPAPPRPSEAAAASRAGHRPAARGEVLGDRASSSGSPRGSPGDRGRPSSASPCARPPRSTCTSASARPAPTASTR